ncbi:hypothetical protein SDC9_174101 [bioreactor metagenome]|uniref:Uncharacterized protein n=1 Tax=bioreactor metagenome TaxID=1076179 RepID=A0A645GKD1_9ZZZZ
MGDKSPKNKEKLKRKADKKSKAISPTSSQLEETTSKTK